MEKISNFFAKKFKILKKPAKKLKIWKKQKNLNLEKTKKSKF